MQVKLSETCLRGVAGGFWSASASGSGGAATVVMKLAFLPWRCFALPCAASQVPLNAFELILSQLNACGPVTRAFAFLIGWIFSAILGVPLLVRSCQYVALPNRAEIQLAACTIFPSSLIRRSWQPLVLGRPDLDIWFLLALTLAATE